MLSMHSLHSLVIMASWHCLVPLVSGQTEPWMRTPPPPPMPPGATADSFVRQSWMSDDYGYSRYGGKAVMRQSADPNSTAPKPSVKKWLRADEPEPVPGWRRCKKPPEPRAVCKTCLANSHSFGHKKCDAH